MKVIVTGSNGFLGSWLTRRLVDEGHDVSILIRKSSDLSELENLKLEKKYGDVTDLESLYKAFRGNDVVFHLAGVVAYKRADRALMEKVNVRGTQNVIQVTKDLKLDKLVHLSSVVAVGAGFTPQEILNEQSPYNLDKLNLGYYQTKHDSEIAVKKATDLGEIQSVIVNPSTIYGAGDAKKGSRSTQLKVARGDFPIYPSGGVNVVAVEDVIDGIMAAWNRGKNGERYILASENLLIKELFEKIAHLAGVKPPETNIPFSLLKTIGWIGEILDKVGLPAPFSLENAWSASLFNWYDNTKAKNELGFNPKPADYALENSVKWIKDHGYLNKQ